MKFSLIARAAEVIATAQRNAHPPLGVAEKLYEKGFLQAPETADLRGRVAELEQQNIAAQLEHAAEMAKLRDLLRSENERANKAIERETVGEAHAEELEQQLAAAQAAPPAADLAAIAARANAATPGPWEPCPEYGPNFYAYFGGSHLQLIGDISFGEGEQADADREFVLHARTDVPALLARVAELEAQAATTRAEAIQAAKLEVVGWLAKKAREYRSTGSRQHALQADAIATLASKVDRGAVRIFLGTPYYRDAMDEHRAEVLAEAREIALTEAKRLDAEMSGDAGYGARAVARLLRAEQPDTAVPLPGSPAHTAEEAALQRSIAAQFPLTTALVAGSPAHAAGADKPLALAAGADDEPEPPVGGVRPCGHDDYHDAHDWADQPDVWCPGRWYDAAEAGEGQ